MNNLIKKGSLFKLGYTLFLVLDVDDEKYKLYFLITSEAFTIHNLKAPNLDWQYMTQERKVIDAHLKMNGCSVLR
jgi:hypothetical protein